VALWGILQLLNWILAEQATADYHQVILLPAAYVITILPALLTAVADGMMAKRNVRHRLLWTAFAGYVFIFLPLLTPLSMGHLHGSYLLLFGIIGAVPAAICSWLSG